MTPAAEFAVFTGSGSPEAAAGIALTARLPLSERWSLGISAGYLETSILYSAAGSPASVPLSRLRAEVLATWRLLDAGSLFALHAQGGAGVMRLRTEAHTVSLGAFGDRTLGSSSETRAVVSVSLPLVFFAGNLLRIEVTPGVVTAPWHDAWSTQYFITGGLGVAVL